MGIVNPDSVTLITGAGSGFGRAILLEMIREGGARFILCDINESPLRESETLAKELNSSVEFFSSVMDVSEAAAVEALVTEGVAKFGRIDHSVHCAGIAGKPSPTDESSVENFQKITDVNTRGVWLFSKFVIGQMKKQEPRKANTGLDVTVRGSIVNIASLLGLVGNPMVSAYSGSKHAVVGMSKSDAADGAKHGIRVNAVCPGYCRTNLLTPETFDQITAMVQAFCPSARLGYAEEVANVVVFLLSDKATYVTGAAIAVDGGHTCI